MWRLEKQPPKEISMVKGSRTTFLIGETHKTKFGTTYTIVGYPENPRRRIIRFSNGEERSVLTSMISLGNIKSKHDKTVYGVGCLGEQAKNAWKHPLYYRWTNMIGRCYSPKHSGYHSYGAKGVHVSEELHNFSNYIQIVSSLPNYNQLLKNPDQWDIDKDVLSGTCYSKDTITIVQKSKNIEIENATKRMPVLMIDKTGKTVREFSSISEAEQVTGVHRGNIARAVRCGYAAGEYLWSPANA
jgi:hypothetical protein